LSISGLDEVRKQSPGVIPLRESMEECLDADSPIIYQSDGTWSGAESHGAFLLHKKWHAAACGDAVATIPLHSDDRVVAVLALRRRAEQPFTPELIEDIRRRIEPFGPAMVLVTRANRSLRRHAVDAARNTLDWITAPGRVRRRIGVAVAAIAVLWFFFGTLDYQLTVPAVVAPLELRHVTAPEDGVLLSASAKAGDVVKAGQVLCALDTTELQQERIAIHAEIAVFDRDVDHAMAANAPAAAQLGRAKRRLAETRLAGVERRIAQSTLRAPVDGVVVRGDLSKRAGSVVTRGEPFFELAPLDRWTLELFVPDAASEDLSAGLAGSFATLARPERPIALRVVRVRPQAELHEEKNVFVAEADVAALDELRPGMEGIANVSAGRKPVWWIVFHRAIDYARLSWWL
jgi:multidrug efflux pump subunit AcrA (membrane-fusion protein)